MDKNKKSPTLTLTNKCNAAKEAECDVVLDTEIDRLLDEKAAKSNLSVFNVKSILRQLIKNQMVQEVLQLKMRQEDSQNANGRDGDDEDSVFPFEPKLTRAKTKELIQNNDQLQMPLWPISPAKLLQVKQPPSETQILITSHDLPEESEAEDDEYIPKETDFQFSDDDASMTSMSDVGSPATPSMMSRSGSVANRKRREALGTSNRFNSDPVFKTPSPKKLRPRINAIGSRTRSKLPLNDTPLEVLEKQLIPPDITTDMYEWNESDNEDYLQFLKTFAFSAVPDGGNDDEEADPEYNVMEDEEDDHDKEEHRVDRAVKVSKKELNELIAELFDGYQISANDDTADLFTPKQVVKESKALSGTSLLDSKVTESSVTKVPTADVNSNVDNLITISTDNQEVYKCTTNTSTSIENSFTSSTTLLDTESPTNTSTPSLQLAKQPVQILPRDLVGSSELVISESLPLFTDWMHRTLRHQMQKHIQLLATTYVLSSAHEDTQVLKVAHSSKSLLLEISEFANKIGPNSAYAGINLKPAIDVLQIWPPKSNQINNGSPIKKKILEDYRSLGSRLPDFETRAVKLIIESSAFMYPGLLPLSLGICTRRTPSQGFTMSEDNLIARGIEELKDRRLSFQRIASMLSETLLPTRSTSQILNRIKNMRKVGTTNLGGNPLKNYFENQIISESPIEAYVPVDASAPIHQPREHLNPKWRKLVEIVEKSKLLLSAGNTIVYYNGNLTTKKKGTKERATNGKRRWNEDATEEKPVVVHSSADFRPHRIVQSPPRLATDCQVFSVKDSNGRTQFYYTIPNLPLQQKSPTPTVLGATEQVVPSHTASSVAVSEASVTNINDNPIPFTSIVKEAGAAENTGSGEKKDQNSPEGSSQSQQHSKAENPLSSVSSERSCRSDKAGGEGDEDEDDDKREKKRFKQEPIFDEYVEEDTENEEDSFTEQFEGNDEEEIETICLLSPSPERKRDQSALTSTTPSPNKQNREYDSASQAKNTVMKLRRDSGCETLKEAGCENFLHEEHSSCLPDVDDDVLGSFSEAFLISVRDVLEKTNPSLYDNFLQLFHDSAASDMTEDQLYLKAEELLQDFPDLIKEFRGLQSAEAAFTTGNFNAYKESNVQIEFLQLLQKWASNCPELKTKIIAKMRSFQSLAAKHVKAVDALRPLFSQITIPLILDSFMAFFLDTPLLRLRDTEEHTETTDEEIVNEGATVKDEKSFFPSPVQKGEELEKTQTSKKRQKTFSGSGTPHHSKSSGGSKRKKYNTTPVEQLLLESSSVEDDDVVESFSEAFLMSVKQRLEGKNPFLYAAFLQLFQDCATNDMSDQELYSKAEDLLKDYPDLINEFRGLQTAEVAFTTGSFVQYKETHAQIHFLDLLEKWTVNCPQLKTKIIQKLKSLQDTVLTESKIVDVMQPLFSQIQSPLILDSFKALFPTIFRPQTTPSDTDYEEVDLDCEENTKHEMHGHHTVAELELDHFETVKLPEEKQVIATNSCPCTCHGDPENVHYHTRARHCNKCCLRFQDGKLFLHSGRVMKPVSIEYTSPELSKQVFVSPTYGTSKTTRPSASSPSMSTALAKKPGA